MSVIRPQSSWPSLCSRQKDKVIFMLQLTSVVTAVRCTVMVVVIINKTNVVDLQVVIQHMLRTQCG